MMRYEILPAEQRVLLPDLRPAASAGYALYGGTAIALQLGHRESIDFDFFSAAPLEEDRLIERMPFLGGATTIQRAPETWTVLTCPAAHDKPVKLSFFGGMNFGRVGSPVIADGGELVMASLDDLLGHKLKVILQRIEAKDYQDIAAMLRTGQELERGLGTAAALFGPNFPPAEAVRAMTYFKDGDLDRLADADRATLIDAAARAGRPHDVAIASMSLLPERPASAGLENAKEGPEPSGFDLETTIDNNGM